MIKVKHVLKTCVTMMAISVMAVNPAWGQAALAGDGTAANPYLITSVDDWNAFAASGIPTGWTRVDLITVYEEK